MGALRGEVVVLVRGIDDVRVHMDVLEKQVATLANRFKAAISRDQAPKQTQLKREVPRPTEEREVTGDRPSMGPGNHQEVSISGPEQVA